MRHADDTADGIEVLDPHTTSPLGKRLQAIHVIQGLSYVLPFLGICFAVTAFVPQTWVVGILREPLLPTAKNTMVVLAPHPWRDHLLPGFACFALAAMCYAISIAMWPKPRAKRPR